MRQFFWRPEKVHGTKGRILIGGGYGSMGCALPYAIGASIAAGNAPVFCIAGDGGFQMNLQELAVLQREQLPIKIFVLNNRVLGKISETQHFNHGDRFANTTAAGGYTVPDFVSIAKAYGLQAAHVDTPADLSARASWLTDAAPCLFEIALPENSFLTPKIKFETGEITPALDDRLIAEVTAILAANTSSATK